jgi:hypothetical protein
VWFYYVPPDSGRIKVSTCGSDFDTVLQVYSGTCGSLIDVDCSSFGNFDCFGNQATIQVDVTGGTQYLIFAAGNGGASGNLVISNLFCQPPVITGGVTNSFLTETGILVTATISVSGTPPFNVTWSDGPLTTNTGNNLSVAFLIPLDQVPDFLSETNFSQIFVNVLNDCGGVGGDGGFPSPCVVCLSRGVPVSSTTTVNASGAGPNFATACGNLGFAGKWFDMAAADFGSADVSIAQSSAVNCLMSVFSGTLPTVSPVACIQTVTNRQVRLQFQATPTQHYYLVVTNTATITNMTYGFVPRLSGSMSNGQFQLRSGAGPALPYTIQTSTGIVSPILWSNLFSATFPTNGIRYSDATATNFARRFYRVIPNP